MERDSTLKPHVYLPSGLLQTNEKHEKDIESDTQNADELIRERSMKGVIAGCRRKNKNEEETFDAIQKRFLTKLYEGVSKEQTHAIEEKNKVEQDCEEQPSIKHHWRPLIFAFGKKNLKGLESRIKILELENQELRDHNAYLKESNEKKHRKIENLCQQRTVLEETKEKLETDNLQEESESLNNYLTDFSNTMDLIMEQSEMCQECKSSLEERMKMVFQSHDNTEIENDASYYRKESADTTIVSLERKNKSLQNYSSALEENIKDIITALEDSSHHTIHYEKIIERLKISESALEETVNALLKASDDQQEKVASLKLRIEELEEKRTRNEEFKEDIEKTVKMLMEENERYQIKEAASQDIVTKCREEIERYRESHLCVVCINEEVKNIFLPCHHLITCSSCSKSLLKCPLCRQEIEASFPVYMQ